MSATLFFSAKALDLPEVMDERVLVGQPSCLVSQASASAAARTLPARDATRCGSVGSAASRPADTLGDRTSAATWLGLTWARAGGGAGGDDRTGCGQPAASCSMSIILWPKLSRFLRKPRPSFAWVILSG